MIAPVHHDDLDRAIMVALARANCAGGTGATDMRKNLTGKNRPGCKVVSHTAHNDQLRARYLSGCVATRSQRHQSVRGAMNYQCRGTNSGQLRRAIPTCKHGKPLSGYTGRVKRPLHAALEACT